MAPVDVSWLVRLRWAAAALFLLLALAARSVFHIPVPVVAVAVVWGLEVASNVALALWVRRHRTVRATTVAALMALDTLLLTVLLALSGGPSNPFSVLYLVDVALGAVVLTPSLTWALLALVLACFGSLFLPAPWSGRVELGHAELMRLHLRGMWVAFALAGGMLVIFVLRVRRALADREAKLDRSASAPAAGPARLARHARRGDRPRARVSPLHHRRGRARAGAPAGRAARGRRGRAAHPATGLALPRGAGPDVHRVGAVAGEALHPRPVSLLLEEALDGLDEPDRVRVEVQDGVRQATAALPVRAVGQSVQALVRNALQASPAGVPVLLRLELDGDRLRVEVEDRGAGMAPEVLARAGEPFFSTRGFGPRARARAVRGPEPRRAARGRPEPGLKSGPGHPCPAHRPAGPRP